MASLRLPTPLFINGPVDTSPLNIATIRPVALIIKLSTGVNASIIGVNMTPPPMPASTAIIAMAKLSKKNPKSTPVMLLRAIPPGGIAAPLDISISAIYEIITTTNITLSSSHGDLAKFIFLARAFMLLARAFQKFFYNI